MTSSTPSEDPPSTENGPRALTHSTTARALRTFLITSGLWGAWMRMVGVGTATFTGFALSIGATESEIALFVSIASFTSLIQIATPAILRRIHRRKTFLFSVGFTEILLRSSPVLIPLFFITSYKIEAMAVLLGLGFICGQLLSPVYHDWLSSTIPESRRGRFTGKQTTAQLVTGIVAAYIAGWYLDLFPKGGRYPGFLHIFTVATVLGIAGYANLMRNPLHTRSGETRSGSILTPFS